MSNFSFDETNIEALSWWVDKEYKMAYYIYRLKNFKCTDKLSDIRLRESIYDGD